MFRFTKFSAVLLRCLAGACVLHARKKCKEFLLTVYAEKSREACLPVDSGAQGEVARQEGMGEGAAGDRGQGRQLQTPVPRATPCRGCRRHGHVTAACFSRRRHVATLAWKRDATPPAAPVQKLTKENSASRPFGTGERIRCSDRFASSPEAGSAYKTLSAPHRQPFVRSLG